MLSPAGCAFATLVLVWATVATSGEPVTAYTPQQVIEKAIAHHDPNGLWDTGRIELEIHTTYADNLVERFGGNEARLTIVLSPGHERFGYTKVIGDDTIEIVLKDGLGRVAVNGSTEVSDADQERLGVREPALYRDYCEYLYGMPMKLRDAGAVLDPRVNSVRFNDRVAWEVRVTYDPEVGEHTWYFYFDNDSFALIGYKFYKDESKNDGEYITFVGEIVDEVSGLRLPKARAWYYNADGGYLATDDIVSITVTQD